MTFKTTITLTIITLLLITGCTSPRGEKTGEAGSSPTLSSVKDFDSLLKDLQDENPKTRWTAVLHLGKLKDPRAVEPLIRALGDDNGNVAVLAAWALGKIRDKRAVEPLARVIEEHIEDESPAPSYAIWALGEIGDPRAGTVLNRVIDEWADFGFKENAVRAMVKIGGPETSKMLIEYLKNDDENARSAAALCLAKNPDPKALEPLIAALDDPDDLVKTHAALALGAIGNKKALPALEKHKDSSNNSLRMTVQSAIEAINTGDKKVLLDRSKAPDPMEERIAKIESFDKDLNFYNIEDQMNLAMAPFRVSGSKSPEQLLKEIKDGNPDVRARAINALGNSKSRDQKVIDALIARLDDENSNVRWNAAKALGKLGDRRGVKPLIEALKDKDKDVRTDAAEALGRIEDPVIIEPLIKLLKDEHPSVRICAADSLGRFERDRRVIDALIGELHDPFPAVRRATVKALSDAKDPYAIPALEKMKKDPDEKVRIETEKAIKRLVEVRDRK